MGNSNSAKPARTDIKTHIHKSARIVIEEPEPVSRWTENGLKLFKVESTDFQLRKRMKLDAPFFVQNEPRFVLS